MSSVSAAAGIDATSQSVSPWNGAKPVSGPGSGSRGRFSGGTGGTALTTTGATGAVVGVPLSENCTGPVAAAGAGSAEAVVIFTVTASVLSVR